MRSAAQSAPRNRTWAYSARRLTPATSVLVPSNHLCTVRRHELLRELPGNVLIWRHTPGAATHSVRARPPSSTAHAYPPLAFASVFLRVAAYYGSTIRSETSGRQRSS